MAFKGKQMLIYGAFKKKADAERRHKKHKRSFVVKRRIKGETRYVVMERKR